jgi:hypothetical protein
MTDDYPNEVPSTVKSEKLPHLDPAVMRAVSDRILILEYLLAETVAVVNGLLKGTGGHKAARRLIAEIKEVTN